MVLKTCSDPAGLAAGQFGLVRNRDTLTVVKADSPFPLSPPTLPRMGNVVESRRNYSSKYCTLFLVVVKQAVSHAGDAEGVVIEPPAGPLELIAIGWRMCS